MRTQKHALRLDTGIAIAVLGVSFSFVSLAVHGSAAAGLVLAIAAAAVGAGLYLHFQHAANQFEEVAGEHEALNAAVGQMDALLRATSQIALARPLGDILEEIYSVGARILRNDRCVIFEARDELVLLFRRDVTLEFSQSMKTSYKTRSGLFSSARMDLIPIEDCQKDKRLAGVKSLLEAESLRSLLFVPLVYEKMIVGFMFLFYEQRRPFSVEELSLAAAFGSQAAIAIRNGEMRQELDGTARDYRNMFENASDLIWTLDPDGRCTTINRRGDELTGRKTPQWIGQPFVQFVVPDDRAMFSEKIKGTFAGKALRFDLRLEGQGRVVYLSVNTTPLYREGEVTAIVAFARDQSEERKLNEQLMQSQRMESLGTLAGGIAHDFNNILSSILGHANLLRSKMSPESEGVHNLELIEKSARRAGHLTGQLLGFARKGHVTIEPIDLNSLLEETVTLLERGIEKTIEIKLELAAHLPPVMGDATQIQQVFMNLVLNARDAMEGNGTLWVKTLTAVLDEHKAKDLGMRTGPCVVVGVRDSGPGVKPEDRGRIFEPFFTTKEFGKGTGLGLSMVYGIMKNHGGAVQVASVPGHGATFSLYFCPTPVAPRPSGKSTAEPASIVGGDETILVVDDEEAVLEVATETLRNAGYKVLTANDGADGVTAFEQRGGEIDMVVLDVMMPRMGGRLAFFKMRELDPTIPVLIMSGYSTEEDIQVMVEAGVNGFIEKPFVLSDLLTKVREILDKRREQLPAAR